MMVVQTDGGEKFCQVLIIEDDQDDAFLLRRALTPPLAKRNLTLGVTHAVNGLDALGSVARSDVLNRLPHGHHRRSEHARGRWRPLPRARCARICSSAERPLRCSPHRPKSRSTRKALASGADAVFSASPNTQEELVEIARRILRMGGCFRRRMSASAKSSANASFSPANTLKIARRWKTGRRLGRSRNG